MARRPTRSHRWDFPRSIGLPEAEALSKLQAAGLTPHVVREYSPRVPDGVVMAQLPSAHSLAAAAPKRSLLWLWIALGVLALLLIGGLWYMNQNRSSSTVVVGVVASDTVEATTSTEPTAPVEATTGKVPNVVGMSEKDAEAALEDAGFTALATKVTTNDTPEGDVVAQVPEADKELTLGSQVAIEVAQAKEPEPPSKVTVPNVVGMTQANAQSALVKAGLAPSFVNQANDAPKGQAFEQQPASGESVDPETVVLVAISTGPEETPEPSTVAVPAVIGKTQADAEKALTGAGLTSQVVQSYSSSVAKGTVGQQWPPAGNKVAPGTPVALVVSMGPKPADGTATVPDVKGMDADGATQALADVGLVAQAVQIDDPTATPGVVLGQLPAASLRGSRRIDGAHRNCGHDRSAVLAVTAIARLMRGGRAIALPVRCVRCRAGGLRAGGSVLAVARARRFRQQELADRVGHLAVEQHRQVAQVLDLSQGRPGARRSATSSIGCTRLSCAE